MMTLRERHLSLCRVRTTKELHCTVGISRSCVRVTSDRPTLIRIRDPHGGDIRPAGMDQLQTTTHTARHTHTHRHTGRNIQTHTQTDS